MLAVFVALLLTVRSWGARVVSGQDAMALVIRTRFGLDQILVRGRLDGWLPTFAAGYQEFLFYGPGQTWLIGVSRVLTLGQLSDVGGLKVEACASLALFPLSVAWLATSMGLSKRAGGVAALLSLAVSNPFGVGLHAVFDNSLIAQQVAASLVFVALGAVLRILVNPRRRWALVAGVALAPLMVTHLISTVILALLVVLAVPTLFVTDRLSWRAVRELSIAGAIGLGLAAFWLVPLLAHRNLHGPVATWATPPLPGRLRHIWDGTFLLRRHVAAEVAVGGLYGLWRIARRRRYATTLLVVPVGYLVLCRFLLHQYPHNEFAIQLENRGLGMAAVIAMFPLAALIGDATARLPAVGELAAIGLAAVVALAPLGSWTKVAAQTASGTPALRQAAVALRQLVPAGARFVEVRQFPQEIAATGVIHPDFWLAAESGRDTLNVFNPESSSVPDVAFTPDHLLDRSPDLAAADLAQLGVTDVVCTTATCTSALASSSRLHVVWHTGGLTIFSVAGASLLTTPGPGSARLVRSDPSHLAWALDFPAATSATIAVAWSPKWHARIDGHAVRLTRGQFGVLALDLPAGAHRLDVSVRADGWDWLGFFVSVATVMAIAGWLLERRAAAIVPVPFRGDVGVCR